MGINYHNVSTYYHGNDGERGLRMEVHIPFDDKDISDLSMFIENDDPKGFAKWLKDKHPKAYKLAGNGQTPCLYGTFMTIKESGVLNIQSKRKPNTSRGIGPRFPGEWEEKAREIYDSIEAEG